MQEALSLVLAEPRRQCHVLVHSLEQGLDERRDLLSQGLALASHQALAELGLQVHLILQPAQLAALALEAEPAGPQLQMPQVLELLRHTFSG
jgi:hypothetical protein